MSTERIVDRIRKLLALANDTAATEGERDNAMRMAHATLVKHNLSMTDVGDGLAASEKREDGAIETVVYPWARTIAHSIAKLFFCEYYFERPLRGKKGRHVFIGRTSNVTTATLIAEFVIGSVSKESVRLYRSATSPMACSFDKGAAEKVRSRCYTLRKEAEAANAAPAQPVPTTGRELVLASVYKAEQELNAAWIKDHVGKLKVVADREQAPTSRGAYAAGSTFGGKVSLTPQIGAGKAQLKLGR